jgi:hypothetical protein
LVLKAILPDGAGVPDTAVLCPIEAALVGESSSESQAVSMPATNRQVIARQFPSILESSGAILDLNI